MTLSRRILLKNGLLVLGLLVLSGISLLGLRWLRMDVRVALNEYQEMETIEQVRGRVASAAAALDGAAPEFDRIQQDLSAQARRLRKFSQQQAVEEQDGLDEGDEGHDRREAALANSAVANLDQASHAIAAGEPGAARAPLRDTDAALASIAAEGNALIHQTQVDSHHDLRVTTDLVAAIAIAITAGAVLVSISQYRSVMGPLGRLRQAVRSMATGDFKKTLPPERDAEFIDLANDFNRMAGELDHFYQRLEDMVAEKSRELVRTERLASVGFLAAGVAHEINNPLNIITGYAELTLKRLAALDGDPAAARE